MSGYTLRNVCKKCGYVGMEAYRPGGRTWPRCCPACGTASREPFNTHWDAIPARRVGILRRRWEVAPTEAQALPANRYIVQPVPDGTTLPVGGVPGAKGMPR